jgi:hypothetical protein
VTTPILGGSPVKWYPNEGHRYIYRLIAFLKQEDYYSSSSHQSYKVDSSLTEEVVQITIDHFIDYYQDYQGLIAEHLIAAIGINRQYSQAFITTIVERNKVTRYASSKIKEKLVDALIHSLADKIPDFTGSLAHQIHIAAHKIMGQSIVTSLSGKALTVAFHTISTPMVKMMLIKYSSLIMSHIGVVLTKLMALPAIKAAIGKLVFLSVATTLVKIISIKLGLSVASTVTIVLVPILFGLLALEWSGFSKKLGDSIAKSTIEQLGGQFAATNHNILDNLFDEFLDCKVTEFGEIIADDEEITKNLKRILELIKA